MAYQKRLSKPGDVHSRLTIIEEDPTLDKGQRRYYFCKCECGKITRVEGYTLRKGITKSCGCIWDEIFLKTRGEISWNYYYSTYKTAAKSRNHKFEITKQEFKEMAIQDCQYCGQSPERYTYYDKNNKLRQRVNQEVIDRSYIYVNGIDRVNNNEGYIISNIVPCCPPCNYAKRNQTEKEFIDRSCRIADYSRKIK